MARKSSSSRWPPCFGTRNFTRMNQPRRLSLRDILIAALAFTATSNTLAAQCPEGTPPPPCKSASPAAGRRVYPALNPRAWIVVPFGNVTKSPELDWLRDASVNLLSLDLSRWSDITVINDKRIGDLVRELPPARAAGTLTLSDGLTLAKRAGAGMLVMGDYFRYGKGARLVANVFDVRTGNKMRSVEQQASDQDALLTAFTPLARGVLAVPPPPDAKLGALGTSRVDAYQEYLLGAAAINQLHIVDAESHFVRAITLDSTFALAHYKLSLVYGWRSTETARTDSLQRQNAVAAVRFGAALPARERALMAGQLAAAQSEYSRACEIFRPLVAKDSTDVEALYQLGECSFHDFTVDPSPTDSTIGRFRQSWNTAFRSFRKVLRLDPGFHIAYTHFVSLSTFYGSRYGCPHPDHGRFCADFEAILHRDGDSLIELPINAEQNPKAWRAQVDQSIREKWRPATLREPLQMIQEWVDFAPGESRARFWLARILDDEGKIEQADEQLRRVVTAQDPNLDGPVRQWRLELALKLGRGAEAHAWFDSVVANAPDRPANAWRRASWSAVFGKFARWTAFLAQDASRTLSEKSYLAQVARLMLGVPADSVTAYEREYFEARGDTSCHSSCREDRMLGSLAFGLRVPRTAWPTFAGEPIALRLKPAWALSRGDTAALRDAAVRLEAYDRAVVIAGYAPPGASSVVAADAYLILRDSVAALRALRFFVDSAIRYMPLFSGLGDNNFPGSPLLWVRGMLQRADLAAALGYKDEARMWYTRVLDLWAEADMDVQPTVVRIRAAVTALGPPQK